MSVYWLTVGGIYFVTWWIVLFAVLPWGVQGQHEAPHIEPGTEPGAPIQPGLLKKVLATTVATAVVVAVGLLIWESDVIPWERLPMPYPSFDR